MIQRKYFLLCLTALASLSLGLASCSNDPITKPKPPTDETLNKNHDLPAKVVVTLARGHFHGSDFHGNPEIMDTKIYNANLQVITLESTPNGFKPTADSPKVFAVQGGIKPGKEPINPATANWTDEKFSPEGSATGLWQYALIIKMYAANGDEITGQFSSPEESRIHQIFFVPKDITSTKFGDQSRTYSPDYTFLNYYYMDTDPWNTSIHQVLEPLKRKHASDEEINNAKNKAFKGVSNPIGLKGFIEFYQIDTRFNLNIKMMHARVSKFLENGKKTSPFYKPTPQQLHGDDWNDLNITVPFVVFGHAYNDDIEADTYEDMTQEDIVVLDKLADAFGVSRDDETTKRILFNDYYNILNNVKPEDINAGIHL